MEVSLSREAWSLIAAVLEKRAEQLNADAEKAVDPGELTGLAAELGKLAGDIERQIGA